MIRRIIVLSLILGITFLLWWFGSYLYHYDPEYHEPRDQDRETREQGLKEDG
ncbi:hypothetical protein MYX65_02045 [Acidobacteria bacterium AH-259-L09]|nr:hypothetical protein [Acidobacteria bacterium AH-259-L09]